MPVYLSQGIALFVVRNVHENWAEAEVYMENSNPNKTLISIRRAVENSYML